MIERLAATAGQRVEIGRTFDFVFPSIGRTFDFVFPSFVPVVVEPK